MQGEKLEYSVACMVKPKFRKFRHSIEPPQLLVVPFRIKDVRSLFRELESNDCLGIDCLQIFKEILIQTEKSDLLEKVIEMSSSDDLFLKIQQVFGVVIRYQFLQISHVLCLLHPFHHTEFGEGDVKNTHTRTHFSSAKRVGRFPRWYGLPPILLPLLLSHVTHTYLTITSPLSGRCPCMLTCELTASIKIQRTHFCPLPYYVTLHCITYLFLTVVW